MKAAASESYMLAKKYVITYILIVQTFSFIYYYFDNEDYFFCYAFFSGECLQNSFAICSFSQDRDNISDL